MNDSESNDVITRRKHNDPPSLPFLPPLPPPLLMTLTIAIISSLSSPPFPLTCLCSIPLLYNNHESNQVTVGRVQAWISAWSTTLVVPSYPPHRPISRASTRKSYESSLGLSSISCSPSLICRLNGSPTSLAGNMRGEKMIVVMVVVVCEPFP